MEVPVLTNTQECLDRMRNGERASFSVEWDGSGEQLAESQIDELCDELETLPREAEDSDVPKHEFDAPMAEILHRRLPLSRADAARGGFWELLSLKYLPQLVLWRWGYSDWSEVDTADKQARFLAGRRNTFQRLWLRADVLYQPGMDEPYGLLGYPDEAFWADIFERSEAIGVARNLAKELVRYWYLDTDDDRRRGGQHAHRPLIRGLRHLRPRRQFETMSKNEIRQCFEEAWELSEALENL